jgi:uncharacterized protein
MKAKILLLVLLTSSLNLFSQKLYKAVDAGDIESVKNILSKDVDVNKYSRNGLFPLWRAAADNKLEICKLLIDNGANIYQKSKVKPGKTSAIYLPTQEGYIDIVKLLIEKGVDVNTNEFHNVTPLRIAAQNGHLEIVKYLIAKGAIIDTKADDKATPLEVAASKGHIEIAKVLIENGADVNSTDKDGDFPIGEAAKRGYIDMIQLLIDNGADLSLKNNDGKDAYTLAKERGQKKAYELISKYISD